MAPCFLFALTTVLSPLVAQAETEAPQGDPAPVPTISNEGATLWMPPQASTVAAEVDYLFDLITIICVIAFVIVMGAMFYFVIRYRGKPGQEAESQVSHNTTLEVTWTVIPSIVVLFFFWYGFKGFMDMYNPPEDGYEIDATARQWSWAFTYPTTGAVSTELHVPGNTPIVLTCRSDDVLHAFFVPDFRVKTDIVPGRYTKVWFEAPNDGETTVHWLYCAEYCGTSHSDMITKVYVHPQEKFDEWLKSESNRLDDPPVEAGEWAYKALGCNSCHSVDGTANIGPTWKGIYGSEEALTDGTMQLVDENYIRESIYEPNVKIVAGFEPVMNSYKNKITDKHVDVLIAFIKSLSEKGQKELEAEEAAEPEGDPEGDPDSTDESDK